MATTPSPGVNGSPSTPPAPKHGGYLDDWEPYRPRKSVRLASQPKTTASPAASSRPRPKVVSARVNDCPSDGMLLTPKKTPSKAPTTKEGAAIDSLSRDIFGSTSTRVAKKISGSTLESFTAEDVNQDFDIFNDEPNSRIPQKDRSNPFYNPQPSPSTSKKASGKARQVHVPGHGWQSLEEAARRDDGMIASFRGKRFYRHFPKPANTDSDELDELAVEGREKANFTPARLLWPKKEAKRDDDAIADEEAATDVEDDVVEAELDIPSTPVRKGKQPNHKHLASPPTTQRTTRSMDKLGGAPAGGSQRAQLSLSKWGSVAKSSHKSSVTSVKRSGEPLTPDGAKKSRSHS